MSESTSAEQRYFHTGTVCPLPYDHVDTDQIIPKQFLTSTSREGFGDALFYDWRYDNHGKPKPEFVLNQAQFKSASILLAGRNFGCGSSREHAPWALKQYGFKVIIANGFADIFYTNCVNNGVLPISLEAEVIQHLFARCGQQSPLWAVDLLNQQLLLSKSDTVNFVIEPDFKERLLSGTDFIGVTEQYMDAIDAYENKRAGLMPWLLPYSYVL